MQWGGHVFSEDGTRCVIDSPEAIAGVQFMLDLIYKYRISPTPVEQSTMASQGGWGSGTISQFGGGRAAMSLGERWWLCTFRSYKGLRLGAVEAPHGKVRVFHGSARATLINKNSPRRYECLKFLKYLSGEKYNVLVNKQADALAPMISYCYSPEFINNPDHPEEDYNGIWRDTMKYARSPECSLFVNNSAAYLVVDKQLDLVKNGQKTVPQALKSAAKQINQLILNNLEEDTSLQVRYEKLTKGRSE